MPILTTFLQYSIGNHSKHIFQYSIGNHHNNQTTKRIKVFKLVVVQSLSRVRLFATPWTAARQASLDITNSQSLLKLMSTESVMPPNHLILCRPLLLPPSIFPSIRVFSSGSALLIRGLNKLPISQN